MGATHNEEKEVNGGEWCFDGFVSSVNRLNTSSLPKSFVLPREMQAKKGKAAIPLVYLPFRSPFAKRLIIFKRKKTKRSQQTECLPHKCVSQLANRGRQTAQEERERERNGDVGG